MRRDGEIKQNRKGSLTSPDIFYLTGTEVVVRGDRRRERDLTNHASVPFTSLISSLAASRPWPLTLSDLRWESTLLAEWPSVVFLLIPLVEACWSLRILKSHPTTRSNLTWSFILSQCLTVVDTAKCRSAVSVKYGWFWCLLKKKPLLKVLLS